MLVPRICCIEAVIASCASASRFRATKLSRSCRICRDSESTWLNLRFQAIHHQLLGFHLLRKEIRRVDRIVSPAQRRPGAVVITFPNGRLGKRAGSLCLGLFIRCFRANAIALGNRHQKLLLGRFPNRLRIADQLIEHLSRVFCRVDGRVHICAEQ